MAHAYSGLVFDIDAPANGDRALACELRETAELVDRQKAHPHEIRLVTPKGREVVYTTRSKLFEKLGYDADPDVPPPLFACVDTETGLFTSTDPDLLAEAIEWHAEATNVRVEAS